MVIYNEIEPFAAQWLSNLATAGHIAKGDVDARSIAELRAADLVGRAQCHFFAGIGVWRYALRRAGWPDDREVWTGSCPCQPFSAAGKGSGFDDERHLWPTWFALIRECRPSVVFGEQVASPDGLKWLDLVHADLEGAGYAVGAADLPAAGVGAPHIRQRLFFVAYANSSDVGKRLHVSQRQPRREVSDADRCGSVGDLAYAEEERRGSRRTGEAGNGQEPGRRAEQSRGLSEAGTMGHSDGARDANARRRTAARASSRVRGAAWQQWFRTNPWEPSDVVECIDGKRRPIEPGTLPLVDGFASRVGRVRAYGNAIVSEVAVTFIRAAMEAA